MRRSLDVYLWELEKQARLIEKFTAGKTLADYSSDELLHAATERVFTIPGEVLVRIRKHFPAAYDRLAGASTVITFRNQLVHEYDETKDEDVWKIITVSVPALLAEARIMIEEEQALRVQQMNLGQQP